MLYEYNIEKKFFSQLHPSPLKIPRKIQVGVKTHICQSHLPLANVSLAPIFERVHFDARLDKKAILRILPCCNNW